MTTGGKQEWWPVEREVRLRELWSDKKLTARHIAGILNNEASGLYLTRSAVIGKASRMKLEPRARRGGATRLYRERPKRVRPPRPPRPVSPKALPPTPPTIDQIVPVNGGGLTLMEMTRERCHAVVAPPAAWGELARYCGLPVHLRDGRKEAEQYCHGHYAAFHREPQPRS